MALLFKRCAALAGNSCVNYQAAAYTASQVISKDVSASTIYSKGKVNAFHETAFKTSVTSLAAMRPVLRTACITRGSLVRGFATQSSTTQLNQATKNEDPWHDKISHNLQGGDRSVIENPIDELSEHVNISNEIEKEIGKAGTVDEVLLQVSQHLDEFEGPSIATALVTLQRLTEGMSIEEHIEAVHSKEAFQKLLHVTETQMSFGQFSLLQTLQALVALHVQDEKLLSAVTSRLTALVQATPEPQLKKLVDSISSSEYVPTQDLLDALDKRVAALKSTMHPETFEAIDKALSSIRTSVDDGQTQQTGTASAKPAVRNHQAQATPPAYS